MSKASRLYGTAHPGAGQVYQQGMTLGEAEAAVQPGEVVTWTDPDTGDLVVISRPGGDRLPRSGWRLWDL